MKFTKQTLKRMLRTFLQAAIGYMATTGITMLTNKDTDLPNNIHCALIGSAFAAGLSAVMNLESKHREESDSAPEEEIHVE